MNQRSSQGASHRRRRRWYTWTIAAGMSAAVAVVTVASAANLSVSAQDRAIDHKTPCTTLTLPVTVAGSSWWGDYTHVSIIIVPPECYDLDVALVVYDTGGAQLATGTGNTGATGAASITTGSYHGVDVQGVALLIDTWGIRTEWTPPGELPPLSCIPLNRNNNNSPGGQTCTVTISSTTGYYPNSDPSGGELFGFQFDVTSSTPRWRVTIDFDDPFFTWNPQWVSLVSGNVGVWGGCGTSPVSILQLQPPIGTSGEWGAEVLTGENGTPTGGTPLCP
ncbi:MAG: hypothetical protein MUP36_01260 [Demequinaceae bacterium]|nr:hypothetical protein [Demequinaceae bacterium]